GPADVLGLPDAARPVAERLPLTRDHGRDLVPPSGGLGAGAAQLAPALGGGRRHDHRPVTHARRSHRRLRRPMAGPAVAHAGAGWMSVMLYWKPGATTS